MALHEVSPDHSTVSRTRRLPNRVYSTRPRQLPPSERSGLDGACAAAPGLCRIPKVVSSSSLSDDYQLRVGADACVAPADQPVLNDPRRRRCSVRGGRALPTCPVAAPRVAPSTPTLRRGSAGASGTRQPPTAPRPDSAMSFRLSATNRAIAARSLQPPWREALNELPVRFRASDGRLGFQMETSGVRRLNRSSPSRLNRPVQRTDFFHGLIARHGGNVA